MIAQIDTHHPRDTYLELSAARATKAQAVASAAPEVLAAAKEVVGSNVADGVVRHLAASWSPDAKQPTRPSC